MKRALPIFILSIFIAMFCIAASATLMDIKSEVIFPMAKKDKATPVETQTLTTRAHANSGLTIAQWNELPNAERENRLNDVLQDIEALTGDVASRAYRVGVDRNFVYNGKTYKQDAKITMSPDAAAQHLATGALIEIT